MIQGLEPIIVDTFGGLCTSIDRGDLPNGLAAAATDIEYFPGGMQSRGPFQNYLSGLATPVTGIMSYPRIYGTKHRLILLANGTLLDEYAEGSTYTIDTSLGQNLIMRGCTLANRAFVAFSDGKTPSARPMHWNGNTTTPYWDPIGQDGPAWQITQGTGTNAGDATAGFHMSLATYTTRSGYETGPCTANYNTQAASKTYSWTAVPVGPTDVAFVRFYVSPVNDASNYYSSAGLRTNDNSGANFDAASPPPVSYTDQALASANTPLSHARLFAWPLPPCLGLEAYNSRLVAWGALNYQPRLSFSYGTDATSGTPLGLNIRSGFSNLQFDSGAVGGAPHGYGSPAAGGALVTLAGAPTQCYQITGDGASATRGLLQSAISPYRVYTYPPGTVWRMRVRAKKSAGATNGRLSIFTTGGATPVNIPLSTVTTEWAWYDNVYFGATDVTSNIFNIQVDNGGATGILQNGEWVAIDGMWMYPSTAPTLGTYLLISQPNDPETFDYAYGTLAVRPGDGQSIVNCVELRGVLFAFKERSTFGVVDNGQIPANWSVTLVSDTVGCISTHGVARGDGWLVTLATTGVYKFSGGAPDKISQEIQPTYGALNWSKKHLAWAVADTEAQRVYIGIPTGANTYVDTLLVLDYVEGWGDPVASAENGRKWSVWTPPATPGFPCAAYVDRDNGQKSFVVGGGVTGASGYVSKRDATVWSTATDTFGASTPNIMSTYDTATLGSDMTRSFFGYATAKMRGNGGNVTLSYVRPNNSAVSIGTRAVSATPLHDVEWQTSQTDTQIGLRVQNAAGGVFTTRRLAAFKKPAPFSVVRGHNL